MAVMRKKEITRRDIISSAQDVFIEKGYGATSMDDLLMRADVIKGTLYYHFTNKEGLFLSCLNTSMRAF
jgi:AcrR family transcriptional regulator